MTAGVASESFDEIRLKSQQLLLEFIQTEVELGMTFVEVAATERDLGNMEHFKHSRNDAKKASESIRHFMTRIKGRAALAAAEEGFETLEHALAALDDNR